jgi:probable HAF family extracellular repeat protein
MRAVVCALWVLTTASCAHAAASFTVLEWLPINPHNFYYNTTGVSDDGSVVVGISGFEPYEGGILYSAFRWTASSGMVSLGGLPWGYNDSLTTSGDGSVVVGTIASNQAFRWTAGSGWVSLGHLPGDAYSSVTGINADGSVIVGTSYSASGKQAFRWTAGSGMVGLGHLPGTTNSYVTGINADASVIVGTSGSASSSQAFRWTAGSGMVGLGFLPGSTNSSATGVSADGSVVVGTSYPASGDQAFRWTAGTGMVGLGYLPGGTGSSAAAVSADGSVIVGTSYSASGVQAFRWTAGSGMVGLGYLPGGNSSGPNGISADGSVIVGSGSSTSGNQVFRWTAGSGMQSLWDVMATNGLNVDPASVLTATSGISADGNTIVGTQYYPEDDFDLQYGFVATLPGLIGVSPALNINSWSSAAHHLVLSWSTNYTGCTLQSSTDLGSTNWTDCASPAVSGASFVVTNAMSAGAQFFRLKR